MSYILDRVLLGRAFQSLAPWYPSHLFYFTFFRSFHMRASHLQPLTTGIPHMLSWSRLHHIKKLNTEGSDTATLRLRRRGILLFGRKNSPSSLYYLLRHCSSIVAKMAVIKRIEVTIRVNKKNLPEFNDEDSHSDKTSVSKYVEAISGARFEIVAIVPSSYRFASNALGFEASLDGNLVERGLVSEHQYHNYVYTFRGVTRLGDSGWEIQPYRFAEINISR